VLAKGNIYNINSRKFFKNEEAFKMHQLQTDHKKELVKKD
jgi:hypothetical protein